LGIEQNWYNLCVGLDAPREHEVNMTCFCMRRIELLSEHTFGVQGIFLVGLVKRFAFMPA